MISNYWSLVRGGIFWWEPQQNHVSGADVTGCESATGDSMIQPNCNILSLYLPPQPPQPPTPITPNPTPNPSHFRYSSTGGCTQYTDHKDMQTKSFPLPPPPRLTANKMQNRDFGQGCPKWPTKYGGHQQIRHMCILYTLYRTYTYVYQKFVITHAQIRDCLVVHL